MKVIILDRDGVINQDSRKYIKSVDEWVIIPGSPKAIANLTQIGYTIVICSNQSGIGHGLYGMKELNEMHEKMHKLINNEGGNIDAIFICPHIPEDNCECRKPKPGMLNGIRERFNIDDMSKVMFVGDSERDLLAIENIGGIPVLVKTGNGKKTLTKATVPQGTLIFDNLLAVSEYLIAKEEEESE
ncbi:MAG: D-glycero-beta-D-manno-heptose,7-bisphosphate 7-phosphatase [Burkholderiales bacterium]|jgi:D-glycero-D-manno-heptose 1,7-bisphosphate phosphatase|nr:D-glycero-beta-D-manno-heptose,7-bisphosphate 7-phosphatase [Burkholderiales bacterium]